MKKFARILVIAAIFVLLPTMHVSAAFDVFTATLEGWLDGDVWTADDEFASVSFSVGADAIIFMNFDEPTTFSDNFVLIRTNIPVLSFADAESTGARIVSFYADGVALDARTAEIVPFYENDGTRHLSINLEAYELADIEPFSSLELTFAVENMPRGIEDEIADEGDAVLDIMIEEPAAQIIAVEEIPLDDMHTYVYVEVEEEASSIIAPIVLIVILVAVGIYLLVPSKKKKK